MSSNYPKPSKLFYRIGEVSRMTGLEAHVLRYWETEFPHIKPNKGVSHQRLYTKKNIDAILQVKQLLYKDGYTIAGARKHLQSAGREQPSLAAIEAAKKELREVLELLQ
ncbi:MAG: MerR family transcriptional regulator [Nitrospirota bacterium]